jgi:putative transposase
MDFLTVPTITFGVLYCFFVISHDRRRILHFNITKHPTSSWIIQQLREAFPFATAPRFLIHDRDAKYGTEVPAAIRSLKINAVRTSFESPWQNGVAEFYPNHWPKTNATRSRISRICYGSAKESQEGAFEGSM